MFSRLLASSSSWNHPRSEYINLTSSTTIHRSFVCSVSNLAAARPRGRLMSCLKVNYCHAKPFHNHGRIYLVTSNSFHRSHTTMPTRQECCLYLPPSISTIYRSPRLCRQLAWLWKVLRKPRGCSFVGSSYVLPTWPPPFVNSTNTPLYQSCPRFYNACYYFDTTNSRCWQHLGISPSLSLVGELGGKADQGPAFPAAV